MYAGSMADVVFIQMFATGWSAMWLQGLQPDILSVGMMLCQDPTAAVRSAVARQMGHVVCNLWSYYQQKQHAATAKQRDDPGNELANDLDSMSLTESPDDPMQHIVQSIKSLATMDAYQLRQQYVKVSYHVALACRSGELQMNLFEQHFLRTLLELAHDKVANVRLAVAQALTILIELAQLPEVIGVLDMLESDSDLDVVNSIKTNKAKSVESL